MKKKFNFASFDTLRFSLFDPPCKMILIILVRTLPQRQISVSDTSPSQRLLFILSASVGGREAVRGFVQVEWSFTDSMAFTLNVNERVLGVCWSGNIHLKENKLLYAGLKDDKYCNHTGGPPIAIRVRCHT